MAANQINLPPTLDAIANPAAIYENAGPQTVNLSGITAGAGQTEAISVTAVSDNAALLSSPTVSYTSPAATGSLTYQPAANQYGTADVTVTVHNAGLDGVLGTADDGVASQTFIVVVNQATVVAINPTKDNTLIQDATGSRSNGGGDIFVGRTSGSGSGTAIAQRGLVDFNLAGVVPAGATIQNVTLTMYVDKVAVDTPLPVALHKASPIGAKGPTWARAEPAPPPKPAMPLG